MGARRQVSLAAAIIALALGAWIVTWVRMRGMDNMGPGTDLGALGWFVSVWVAMMAAMMLPSVAPMVLTFAGVERGRPGRLGSTAVFVAGYLLAWTAYGLAAYGLFRVAKAVAPGALAWDRLGPLVAGLGLVAAGVYELTPLKTTCLRHCRTPTQFVLLHWRRGRLGALRMGGEHGLWCVGCCWGLMLALFALGVMSLFWMAVVAAVIFVEKLAPMGARAVKPVAAALVVLGLAVAGLGVGT